MVSAIYLVKTRVTFPNNRYGGSRSQKSIESVSNFHNASVMENKMVEMTVQQTDGV
jgi:hypothetical protein